MKEKTIEIKDCKKCNSQFEITDRDMEFYKKVSPTFLGEKFLIPTPELCPDCRNIRRLCFKNIHHLYKNADGIISAYSPNKGFNVILQENWFSDSVSGGDFGRKYDESKPFFSQFHELQKVSPRWNLVQYMSENCDWTINVASCKDSYMLSSAVDAENCIYGERIFESKDIIDSYLVRNSQNCYELIGGDKCMNVFFGQNVTLCTDSYYLFECEGLSDCIGCVGLKNKKYHILNKEYTESQFLEIKDKILNSSSHLESFLQDFFILKQGKVRRENHIFRSENCTGDEISDSRNISFGFSINNSQDSKYLDLGSSVIDVYDSHGPDESECIYETSSNYRINRSAFLFNTFEINNSFYLDTCFNLKNCFGCVGLKNAEYCILNKQYTKEEYEKLVPKIIRNMTENGEWGEFFPTELSPFGYNETIAQDYFPLTKEEVLDNGYKWSDYEAPFPKVDKTIPAEKLPDSIKDIPDDILNWAIVCEETSKPFRIIKQELDFYRKYNLPIPRIHPDKRHLNRVKLRNPNKLFKKQCDNCGIDIQTTYSPDRSETIYCATCYNKEFY